MLGCPCEGKVGLLRRERVEDGGVVCEAGKEVCNVAYEAEEGADVLSAARGRPGENLLHLGAVRGDTVARDAVPEEGEIDAEEVSFLEGTIELIGAKRVQDCLDVATVFLQVL